MTVPSAVRAVRAASIQPEALAAAPTNPIDHAPVPAPVLALLPGQTRARALLLAAGRGERMRALTEHTPKPLLPLHGQPLIAWHLDALARAGLAHCVVNCAWLGEQLPQRLGPSWPPDAAAMALSYSHEGRDFGAALETAGGIARALPLLDDVFWAIAADVWAPGFAFEPGALARLAAGDALAHLWLVPNPAHHPKGDFGLQRDGLACLAHPGSDPEGAADGSARLTFSGIAVYRRALFEPPWLEIAPGNPLGIKAALAPLLRRAIENRRVSAQRYDGPWADVGTPERLAALQAAPLSSHPTA